MTKIYLNDIFFCYIIINFVLLKIGGTILKTLIIHGHSNSGLKISQDSKNRCLKAIELFNKTKFDRIICSGGLFSSQQMGFKNSYALRNWLIHKNVTSKIIIEESQSLTTIDNVEKTIKLLTPEETIYVVTSNYHYLRTKLSWKLVGKRKVIVLLAKSKITFKKILIEAIGILIVFCWYFGYKFPELYVRKKFRLIK